MLGQDAQGPTAVLKSVSKLDNTLLSNGTLLNVKFTPATLEGEAGLRKLADFLRAFTQLKLQHIQFNVAGSATAPTRLCRAGGARCRIQRLLCRTVEGDPG